VWQLLHVLDAAITPVDLRVHLWGDRDTQAVQAVQTGSAGRQYSRPTASGVILRRLGIARCSECMC
jgi:hypothetical protein